jgi:hypothetical protein
MSSTKRTTTTDPEQATQPTEEPRVRECRCGRDGVKNRGQCAVRDGWGALQPGTFCRRFDQPADDDQAKARPT